jgi:7,8-dihydropterin-6-yl-methyl-4-(beta-D-ribofuranosyl)aminobenzene 5'-phosphate synthase
LQIKKISDFQEIGKNIFCMVLKGGLFLYEQILILQTKKGLVIITGCAHPGIIHIIEEAQTKLKTPVYFVMGGFHLFRKKSCFINEIVRTFRSLSVKQVAPCHCSGEATLNKFKEIYCHDFYSIGTGSVLKIS